MHIIYILALLNSEVGGSRKGGVCVCMCGGGGGGGYILDTAWAARSTHIFKLSCLDSS